MIRSFNNLVEMKNKVILKMNKYNLAVTYFLGVSLSGEPSKPLSIATRLLILPILKEKQETLTSVSILVNIPLYSTIYFLKIILYTNTI